jgi:outer membrane cobalamin receptor
MKSGGRLDSAAVVGGGAVARRMAVAIAWALGAASLDARASHDAAELSVEQLLDVHVYTASKFEQRASEAPASVTVVTAADIRTYGWRTLADALRAVRGLFVTYDRNYSYLGVRGYSRPGDYDSRVLLLVDGYRLNDNLYGSANIGTEFPLDLGLVERIEIVRGPGSSIYGSNAFMGVINVITRSGGALAGGEAAAAIGSFGTDEERLSGGMQHGNGLQWLLSASRSASDGQDLYYPEFAATNNGVAEDADAGRAKRLFGKLSAGGFTASALWSRRVKQIPTASFGSRFDDPRERTLDEASYLDLGYYGDLAAGVRVTPHVFYGRYVYRGDYTNTPAGLNKDSATGEWAGAEVKLDGKLGSNHLITGVEYQDDFRQDQLNYDDTPYTLHLDDRRSSRRAAVYAQDELPLFDRALLNAGLRYDHYSTAGGSLNPRAGFVWNAAETATFKAIYGTAFRAPNVYELYYTDGVSGKPNPGLKPEEIQTSELIAELRPLAGLRLAADAYYNRMRDLITQVVDPSDGLLVYQNLGRADGRGVEFEAEQLLPGGARGLASYALQQSRDLTNHVEMTNSPRHLAKAGVDVPVPGQAVNAGVELQYMGRRRTLGGATVGPNFLVNLTLASREFWGGCSVSGGVYNVLDREYADPARPEHVQDTIPQDGRSFRLQLSYRYR